MYTTRDIKSQSKDKKCARNGYQTAMGIYSALTQTQWQIPSEFIANMGEIQSFRVRGRGEGGVTGNVDTKFVEKNLHMT